MEATFGLLEPYRYGAGWPELVRLPKPAAGAPTSFTVPGSRVVRLRAAKAQLTASAQEATRVQHLELTDADQRAFYVSPSSGAIVKSTVQTTSFAVGLGGVLQAPSGFAQVAIPELMLTPEMHIVINPVALQTEDQLDQVILYLENFPTGPEGYPPGVG